MFFNLFFCCSLMAFSFLPLTLFGDSECKRRILNFIFRKNFDNLFYICYVFVAPFSTVFLSLIFGARLKVNALTDATHSDLLNSSTNCWSLPHFSATTMTFSQIFFLLLIKDLPFPEETPKSCLQTHQ